MLYLGCGFFGGVAMGVAYVPAVAVLLKWFPNEKGLASGLAVMGYGAGGMVAAPVAQTLLDRFSCAPDFVGRTSEVTTVTQHGQLFAQDASGTLKEVVYAGASDLVGTFAGLEEGFYAVGTGSSGVAETFMVMGSGYAFIIGMAALQFRYPSPEIEGSLEKMKPKAAIDKSSNAIEPKQASVNPSEALRTKQFWCLWLGIGLNSSAAYSIIASGKTLMLETFGATLPEVVTVAFAGTYVAMISVFNLAGRIVFSTISDRIGRKLTFHILWGSSVPLYLCIPLSVHWLAVSPSLMPLGLFCGSSMLIISCMGATAATFPAYIADLFGPKYVAAIHGQVLSVLIPAGLIGPAMVSILREKAIKDALYDLVSKVSPNDFEAAFGASLDRLDDLIQAKVVTIPRLLELLPGDTIDPALFIYDQTMMAMAGFHIIAFCCNLLVSPVQKTKKL
mmetsp:Transcript_25191/g.60614  ORF Transcript_25191/g.60614 Transcript_25191/m.60614 type:complete len:447 (-) Transcript_25191:30-1370(-)